jgi:cytochrome P450
VAGRTKKAKSGDITIPPNPAYSISMLLSEQRLPAFAARCGAKIAALLGGPVRVGNVVIAARHADVVELLSRDLAFRIGPVNEKRIEAVSGAFVLGMDRGVTLARERNALYEALHKVDLAPIRSAAAHEAQQKIDESGGAIDVVAGYARPIAANTARRLFGVSQSDAQTFMDVARAIFAHTFLNLSGDKVVETRALTAADLLRSWFVEEIKRRRISGKHGSDMMGKLLASTNLDDDFVRRTLSGMLVGSVDTTASCVTKIMSMIGRNKELAAGIAEDAHDDKRLAGWCWEALRVWPHNPIVIREAVHTTRLGSCEVQPGTRMIAWTQAAMLDPSVFPEPKQLRPDRPTCSYLHFGGGVHLCAGRAINAVQIPLLVGALVRRGIKSVGKVQWAGPFPDHLTLTFER